MKHISRRYFLKGTVLAGAAAALPAWSWSQVAGANGDIRVAVVGFRGQGGGHIGTLSKMKGVRVVAVCDADRGVLGAGVKQLEGQGLKVEGYQDVRKLLENKGIDAVSTATPNHWHSLVTVWACQAGKDVYVEKPVSHNVWEGRKAVEAARKYKRIVQAGTQCRSSTGLQEAFKWLWEGNLGKIELVRGLCYKSRGSIGKVDGPQAVPATIDYDLWCGPAPMGPLMRKNLHYDWHWVWATGSGDLGNQGIHQMDIARWILREDHVSARVMSVGGRLGYEDDGETPNTQFVWHDFLVAPLIFEVRGLKTEAYRGAKVGVVADCEGGYMVIPSYTSAAAYGKDGKEIRKWNGGGEHHANWIDAVRSRKHTDLNADILEGHLSSALCHTGNISYRLGAQQRPDAIKEQIKGEKGALETFERMAAHLAENGVDLVKTQGTIGPVLTMDPNTERFTGNEKANGLLSREYRKPFVVPAEV